MTIPLLFASLYDRQEILMWSNCLLDLGTDLLVGNSTTTPKCGTGDTEIEDPHLLTTQNSKIPPLKPGALPYIAMHATPTARNFFLANFYSSGPFTCLFFSKTCPYTYKKRLMI